MLFKKKTKNKKQECKVVFKQKPSHKDFVRRKNSKDKLFTKAQPIRSVKRKSSRGEKIKKIQRRNKAINILFLLFIISFFVFAGYITINFITGIRGGTSTSDILYDKTYIVGIDSVPVYPQSVFVYEGEKDEEIVLRMLNQGISVYRLPRNTRMTEVYEYYEEKLPANDWEYLSTIPISTEDKLLGQYWVKGEKGLRIFVENNDVWYEIITKTDANTALSHRRVEEIRRKRILETSTEQTLLPDYPWILSIPREYLTRYSSTNIGELQAVEIYEIGGEKKFLIYPIGKSGEGTYDHMLEEFFKEKNEDSEEKWGIINTRKDFRNDREVLIVSLTIDGNEGEGVVLMNKMNFIVYIILANRSEEPFFEEIIQKIHEP